nr:unnamed protein product [Digitaria exilis]
MPEPRLMNEAPMERCGDRFCTLPDDVVQHILGFLPALDVVRTCLLGRRWRQLWRSAPRLRIATADVPALRFVGSLNRFIRQVLLLRDPGAPLDECEFDLRGYSRLTMKHDSSFKVLCLLQKPKPAVEMEDINLMGQSLALRHLMLVKVKCPIIDERVEIILKILRACNSCLDQIIVQEI